MNSFTRAAAEDFLFREAELLDAWRLEEWAALFTDDGEYLIPPTNMPEGDPETTLFLIYDDRLRLQERAKRLLKRQAHAEFPHSVTRHVIGNVVVRGIRDATAHVTCNFLVTRSRFGKTDLFPGHTEYRLQLAADGTPAIRLKRVVIDLDALRPHGKVSIIL
jgi:p-cumate 2,3-dioxygenase subunit beta